ncbi:recombinase family protein [Listeria monocytogenes]|nr:recombinase family protein [Listeria monocytogenes]
MFEETASAKDRARPVPADMLAYVREGDTVLVKSPDRLARSTVDLLNLLSELKAKGGGGALRGLPGSGHRHGAGHVHADGARCRGRART